MGFYLKKGFNFGPVRLNLSTSGLGVSVGVKGLRVGTGPRGNYVHAGRYGLYYRASIPGQSSPRTDGTHVAPVDRRLSQASENSTGPMIETDSVSVTELNDSNSEALLQEIQREQQMTATWPFLKSTPSESE